jgi:hypothetical protein
MIRSRSISAPETLNAWRSEQDGRFLEESANKRPATVPPQLEKSIEKWHKNRELSTTGAPPGPEGTATAIARRISPQTNGRIERFHETLKARMNLLVYSSSGRAAANHAAVQGLHGSSLRVGRFVGVDS